MSSAKLIDSVNQIIEIKWEQSAKPEDFVFITNEIERLVKTFPNKSYDVIVDMTSVKAFAPESQASLVEHQKKLLEFGMKRAAVVVAGSIAKMQLNRSARQAEHSTESHWDDRLKALEFLQNNR